MLSKTVKLIFTFAHFTESFFKDRKIFLIEKCNNSKHFDHNILVKKLYKELHKIYKKRRKKINC